MSHPPMAPCPVCKRPIVFMTPRCPHCGAAFGGPGGDDAATRMLLPVGRTPLSIIAGYVGLASILVFVLAPIAIALGIWAIVDLRRQPGKHGMGRAVFAIVIGALVSVLTLLIVLT